MTNDLQAPKSTAMRFQTTPPPLCSVCSRPIDLKASRFVDIDRYIRRAGAQRGDPSVTDDYSDKLLGVVRLVAGDLRFLRQERRFRDAPHALTVGAVVPLHAAPLVDRRNRLHVATIAVRTDHRHVPMLEGAIGCAHFQRCPILHRSGSDEFRVWTLDDSAGCEARRPVRRCS